MIAVRLPDGRTVNVQTNDPAQATTAGRRMLAYEAANKTRPPQTAVDTLADGATLGLDRPASAAMYAGATGLKNLVTRATGGTPAYGMGDAYDAARQLENDRAKQFQTAHPILGTAAGLLGGLAMPGAGAVGDFIGNGAKILQGADGVLPAAVRFLSTSARSGVAGAATGAVNGAATANPGQVAQGAENGAKVGLLTGAALPAVSKAAVGVVRNVAAPMVQTVARAANKASGGALLDASQTAGQRLAQTLKADGATPAQIQTGLNSWLKTGVSPSLMDLASTLPNGGQSTLGLLRGAALKAGPARSAAMTYADKTASDLQGNAVDLARNLTPNKAPAATVAQNLTDARDNLAAQQYPAAHPQAVETAPVLDAVSGQAGQKAIAGAAKLADAVRSEPETAELNAIRTAANPPPAAPPAPMPAGTENLGPAAQAQVRAQLGLDQPPPAAPLPPTVRLGTLDHIKQSLNTMGQDAAAQGDNRLAAGLFQRATEIDDHLAEISPDYAIARDNFHQGSNRAEGVKLGATGLSSSPDDYAAGMTDLQSRVHGQGPSPAQIDAGVGYRQAMTDAIGAPTEGATGILNRIGTSTNQTRNLSATYGDDAAGNFQDGVNNLRRQLANARFIDPSSGSQTAGRDVDANLADVSPPKLPGVVDLLVGMANKVRRGATLTDDERTALINMGTATPTPASIGQLAIPAPPLGAPLSSQLVPALAGYEARQQAN